MLICRLGWCAVTGDGHDMVAHRRHDLVPVAVDERPVEQSMASTAGDARQGRVTPLGRLDHPIESVAQPVVRRPWIGGDTALQDRRDDGQLVVDPLLGDEDAHQRVLQLRGHGEGVDAVVGDGALEPLDEPRRDALALGVE